MAEFLVFLGALVGSITGSLLYEMWQRGRARIIKSTAPGVVAIERSDRPKPFSKPSGKRSPKINDDVEAYNREVDA